MGDSAKARGFHVVTMESGDKAFFSYQGTAKTKDGTPLEGIDGRERQAQGH